MIEAVFFKAIRMVMPELFSHLITERQSHILTEMFALKRSHSCTHIYSMC